MGRALQKSPAPRRLAVAAALAVGLGLVAAGCSAGQVTQTGNQVAVVNGANGQVGDIAVRDAQFQFPVAHGAYEEGDDAPVVVLIANNGGEPDRLLGVTSGSSAPAEITGDVRLEAGSVIISSADEEAGSHSSSTGKPSSAASSASASASADPQASEGSSATTTTTTTTTTAPSGSASASTTTTTTPTSGSAASGTGPVTPTSNRNTSISNPPTTGTKLPSSVDPTEPGVVKIVLKGLEKQLRPGETIRLTFLFEKAGELTLEVPIGTSPEPRQDAPSEH